MFLNRLEQGGPSKQCKKKEKRGGGVQQRKTKEPGEIKKRIRCAAVIRGVEEGLCWEVACSDVIDTQQNREEVGSRGTGRTIEKGELRGKERFGIKEWVRGKNEED